jgi:RimJ/RimL family protein N-acetyltransferase
MIEDLANWQPCPRPERNSMQGRYVRIEPLDRDEHGVGLYEASATSDADSRFAWLYEYPPEDRETFLRWVGKVQLSEDPLFFAVIDESCGKVAGRQTLMRIDSANGAIEIGNIYWGPLISRKPAATEALFLFAKYVFDDLGYRRFEWKCNNRNEPSKRAALRFGFKAEGLFRQHLVVKGANRDTAWFAIIDREWPALRKAYESWLDPQNFDAGGQQKRRLDEIRAGIRI